MNFASVENELIVSIVNIRKYQLKYVETGADGTFSPHIVDMTVLRVDAFGRPLRFCIAASASLLGALQLRLEG